MALQQDPSVPVLSLQYAGARNDIGSISMYQGPDVAGATPEVWTLISNPETVKDIAGKIAALVTPLTDGKLVSATYSGMSFTDDQFLPGVTGEMQDDAIFTFVTNLRKNVSVTVHGFKRSLLVPARMDASTPYNPTEAVAVALSEQHQLVNVGAPVVVDFVTNMLSGITSTVDPTKKFNPHAPSQLNGDIVALVKAEFVQKASPRRSSIRG